jgi:hypothetical protein
VATVQFTVPDALVPRVIAAARASFPQYATLTDAALFRQVTADYWRHVVSGYEGLQAATTQTAQAITDLAGIT